MASAHLQHFCHDGRACGTFLSLLYRPAFAREDPARHHRRRSGWDTEDNGKLIDYNNFWDKK